MKQLTAAAAADLLSGHKCWNILIEQTDGTRRGYTSTAQEIVIDGVTYQPQNGIVPSQYRSDLRPEPSSSEFQGFFSDDQISDVDILSGLLDGATATLFICSWLNPPTSLSDDLCHILSIGELGKATSSDRVFNIEFLTSEVAFTQSFRKRTQPTCRNTLGDSRCQVSTFQYRFTGQITSVTENRDIAFSVVSQQGSAQPTTSNFYRNGRIEFISGEAAGQDEKIRAHSGSTLRLLSRPFKTLAIGDQFYAFTGCNKTLTECNDKFNNTNQFRGEPFVPGPASLVRSPN